MIAFVRDGRGCYRPLGNPERPFTRDWLKEGQKAAVRHALGSRDAVSIIRGVYGTGKTTPEQEIAEAVAETGRPLVALAPTATASDVLREEAGIASAATVERFLTDRRMQESARWGVVLVDEAGMLGTADMLRLFDMALSVKARVILVGDRRQTRSVSAGEPLRLLEERAGLPVAEVTEILRQSGRYKDAANALSEGRVAEALEILDTLGWIRELPDGERYQVMAETYLAAIQEKKRGGEHKTAMAVSPTWAEASRIAGAIRGQLKAEGKLGEERLLDTWIPAHLTDAQKRDAANYEPGDLLVFHQNAPGFRNGSRLVAAEGRILPLKYAERFEVYRTGSSRAESGSGGIFRSSVGPLAWGGSVTMPATIVHPLRRWPMSDTTWNYCGSKAKTAWHGRGRHPAKAPPRRMPAPTKRTSARPSATCGASGNVPYPLSFASPTATARRFLTRGLTR